MKNDAIGILEDMLTCMNANDGAALANAAEAARLLLLTKFKFNIGDSVIACGRHRGKIIARYVQPDTLTPCYLVHTFDEFTCYCNANEDIGPYNDEGEDTIVDAFPYAESALKPSPINLP